MKDWIKELCPEIAEWQIDLICGHFEAIRAENEKLKNRIDRLEWENKGVAEWRGEWAKMRDQRDTLRTQLEQAQADLALREAEVSSLQIDKEQAQADAARWRFVSTKGDEDEQYIGERWEACMEAWDGSDGVVGFERAIDAARAALEDDDEDTRCPTCGNDGGTSCGVPSCGLLTGGEA